MGWPKKYFTDEERRLAKNARQAAWAKENPSYQEAARKRSAAWAKANPEAVKIRNAEWKASNPERKRANDRAWRAANLEKVRAKSRRDTQTFKEKNRERLKRRRRANPEKARAQCAAWAKAHPEQIKAKYHRRRAALREAPGCFKKQDVVDCLTIQGWRCFYCLVSLADGYHVDHMTPISRGGSNGPENIVCACATCNLRKNAKTAAEFILEGEPC